MKILVTGSNGFVGKYLADALRARGDEVVGMDIGVAPVNPVARYYGCNLMDFDRVRAVLAHERPDAAVHLAAVSSVARSWGAPVESFLNNTNIFLNVAEAVRALGLKTRLLSVGSSEEYGNVAPGETPLAEAHALRPCSPYAVARVSQEMLSRLYAEGYGLDIVMTRSFNQFGPGQRPDFVVPGFVRQLVDGRRAGRDPVEVRAGDLSIVRDFLDVRDAVSAYLALLEKGRSGEVYNVCRGEGRTLAAVLDAVAEAVGVRVTVRVDPARIRPADNRCIVGDNAKIVAETGWRPVHDLRRTIADMVASCEATA